MTKGTTVIGVLKQVSTVGGSALRMAGVGAGSPVYAAIQLGNTPVQADDTDKVAVSLYGKGTAAGDTPIITDLNHPGALVTVSAERWEMHQGDQYISSHIFANVAAAASVGMYLGLGADDVDFSYALTAGQETLLYMYENPTVSASGTALAEINMNRGNGNVSSASASYGPTVSSFGTALFERMVPGNIVGGRDEPRGYWNLDATDSYLLRIVNNSAASCNVSCAFIWIV